MDLRPVLKKVSFEYSIFMGEVTKAEIIKEPSISSDIALFEMEAGLYTPVFIQNQTKNGMIQMQVRGDTLRIEKNQMTVLGPLCVIEDNSRFVVKSGGYSIEKKMKRIENETIKNLSTLYTTFKVCAGKCGPITREKEFVLSHLQLIHPEEKFERNVDVSEFATFAKSIEHEFRKAMQNCEEKNSVSVLVQIASSGSPVLTIDSDRDICDEDFAKAQKKITEINYSTKNETLAFRMKFAYF